MTEHPTPATHPAAAPPPRGLAALAAAARRPIRLSSRPTPPPASTPAPTAAGPTVADAVAERAVARAYELDRVVRAAMALHRLEERPDIAPGELDVPRPIAPWCRHCWHTWPCDTVRILGPAVLGDLAVEVDRVRAQAQLDNLAVDVDRIRALAQW